MLLQGNSAMQRVISHPMTLRLLFCFRFRIVIGESRNSTGIANMKLNIRLVIHCLKADRM